MEAKTYNHPHESLGFLLHQSAINWRRGLARELREIELTPVQFFMLGSTSRLTTKDARGPMQREVVDNTGVDVNVVSQVVRQLAVRGLIERVRDAHDGRAFRLRLTEDGRVQLKKAIRLVRGVDELFFHHTLQKEIVASELKKLI